MHEFGLALASSVVISLISLEGAVLMKLGEKRISSFMPVMVAFATGALFGASFFHLIPEVYDSQWGREGVVAGVIGFYLLERLLMWRHCHEDTCDVHAFSYLVLLGDSLHNFVDGLTLGAAFISDISTGVVVAAAIALHELPQELGDFAVLIYGGLGWRRALAYNLVTALTAVVGAAAAFTLVGRIDPAAILAIAAGGFIYIAGSDLVPELHKDRQPRGALANSVALIVGLALMWLLPRA